MQEHLRRRFTARRARLVFRNPWIAWCSATTRRTPDDLSSSHLSASLMTAGPREETRRKRRNVGARHEVRTWLSRETYDRLAREASARHGTLSQSVRECLEEYFVLKQEIASALTPAPKEGVTNGEGVRLAHGLLDDVVRRVVEEIQRRDASSDALREQLRLIAWMIDRAYCGLVGRLPDVEPNLRAARMASAERSVLLWRKAVRSTRATDGLEDA